MTTTMLNEVRAEALFASDLQPSQHPAADQVRRSVLGTLHRYGRKWCAARMAEEFGAHPETAAPRMAWAIRTVRECYPVPAARPAHVPNLRKTGPSRSVPADRPAAHTDRPAPRTDRPAPRTSRTEPTRPEATVATRPEPTALELAGLRCLLVDDEATALERLARLLRTHPTVGQVALAINAQAALQLLRRATFDVAFIETQLSGIDGVQLAWALRRMPDGPQIVFVTRRPERAAEAFDLGALDYITKPVVPERLAESLRRVAAARPTASLASAAPPPIDPHEEVIPVSLAGSTKLIRRSSVRWAQAQGDYVRLHTGSGSYLIRAGMNALADAWEKAGFVRIHRSHLVQLRHVTGVQTTGPGQYTIDVGGHQLPVSRRRATKLPDRLLNQARPGVDVATG
jgi:DNA-binding LytR/AlgR family response regulator